MSHIGEMHGKVQIGREQLGLDDESYRQMLERVIGRRSRKGCTEKELAMIIQDMALHGVVFSAPKKRPYKVKHAHSRSDWQDVAETHPQCRIKRYICAVWRELGYDMNSLDTRVKRQFGVAIFAWLSDPDQLNILAKDLNKRLKEKKKNAGGHSGGQACQA